jgi:hypothetical protein
VSTERFALRLLGCIVLVACLAFFDTDSQTPTQRLGIPLFMALGAWMLVQNLAAVAIGMLTLALIHSDREAASWIDSVAYPLLALGSGLMLGMVAVQRFRRRINRTHEARWAVRKSS